MNEIEKHKNDFINFIKEGGWVGQDGYYISTVPAHELLSRQFSRIPAATRLSAVEQAIKENPDLWTIAESNFRNTDERTSLTAKHMFVNEFRRDSFMFALYSMRDLEEFHKRS